MNRAAAPVSSIGVSQPLVDGPDKVTGRARYAADLVSVQALVGRVLRSPVSHAEITGLDVSRARRLPGVVAVITGDDCDETYGILPSPALNIRSPGTGSATGASRSPASPRWTWRRRKRPSI